MKITVKSERKENMNVPFDEIPVGHVYIAEYRGGPVALKLCNGEAVLLTHWDDGAWFCMAAGFKGTPAYKVLGRLTEIIVEEE